MRRWIVLLFFVVIVLAMPLAGKLKQKESKPPTGVATPLHAAAAGGHDETVAELALEGQDVNARDEEGRTPLHLSAQNGHNLTTQALIDAGADANVMDLAGKTPLDYAIEGGHDGVAARLSPLTAKPARAPDAGPQRMKPDLKYPDLGSFERAINQPGLLLTSEHVYLFASKSRASGANEVFPYLVKAYDRLFDLVGAHTKYIMVFYNFPAGHPDAWGGTGECVVWYDDDNLILERHEEWQKYHVPHVSGYIEEMAHNFVSATQAQFGWEMMGWTIGSKVSMEVAGNPVLRAKLERTRRDQAETFRRYMSAGGVFPADLPPNQVDRIHGCILWECEREYGPSFWADVFTELRAEHGRLFIAGGRDARYRITIECFDRLAGLDFIGKLQRAKISVVTDVKSLNPTQPGWNRRLN